MWFDIFEKFLLAAYAIILILKTVHLGISFWVLFYFIWLQLTTINVGTNEYILKLV